MKYDYKSSHKKNNKDVKKAGDFNKSKEAKTFRNKDERRERTNRSPRNERNYGQECLQSHVPWLHGHGQRQCLLSFLPVKSSSLLPEAQRLRHRYTLHQPRK